MILSAIVDMPLDNSLLEALSKSLKEQLDKQNEAIYNRALTDSPTDATSNGQGTSNSGLNNSNINGSSSSLGTSNSSSTSNGSSNLVGGSNSSSGIGSNGSSSGSNINSINGNKSLESNKNQIDIQNALNSIMSDPTSLMNSLNKLSKEELLASIENVLINLETNKIWTKAVNNNSGYTEDSALKILKALGNVPNGKALDNLISILNNTNNFDALNNINESINKNLDKSVLVASLKDALNNPIFQQIFSEKNKDLITKLVASSKGVDKANVIDNMSELLNDGDKLRNLISNPQLALSTFKSLLSSGNIDLVQFGSCIIDGLETIKTERFLKDNEKIVDNI